MKNYSKSLNTSQTEPIFGRTDMVKNNAGGYSFTTSDQEQLERFLLIGSEGGTYYVKEDKLTKENATQIVKFIQANGEKVVQTAVDFLINNRAPKADASLFVLGLAATYGNANVKKLVYDNIAKVCKTSTHLFTFVANIQNLRGWSRGLRTAVAKFYTEKSFEDLAYQLVKYRNRAGFTHRDTLRLSHPSTKIAERNELFKFAVGKTDGSESPSQLIQAFVKAEKLQGKALAKLIKDAKLTWEMVPTGQLNDVDVLKALLSKMPLTALIRNLNRFASAGLTDGLTEVTQQIVTKLTSEENVKKSGIHPINVVNSLVTYSRGHGLKSSKTWNVNQTIVSALQDTYDLSLKNVKTTGKRILVGVDISGSMQAEVAGMALNAGQLANVLACTMLKTEQMSELVWFDTGLYSPKINKRSTINEIIAATPRGGGTDCSLPILYAVDKKIKYDAIIILTDNETWAGKTHSLNVINAYRRAISPDVKVIEMALASNPYTNLPEDKNFLRVVGFDASVIEVINNYLK